MCNIRWVLRFQTGMGWVRAGLPQGSRRVQTSDLAEQAMSVSGRNLQGMTSVLVNLLRKNVPLLCLLGRPVGLLPQLHPRGHLLKAVWSSDCEAFRKS